MSEASRAWSWRHAFASSPIAATTKAVLHTLGMFMNELGEGCYPSVADICRYSGLDKKTVLKHLALAADAGWIAISQHGYRGQKWKRQEYAARWPERDLVAACPPDDSSQGGGAAPPPCSPEKAVELPPEGGGIEGSKVVEQLHQDKTSPETTPVTSPVERARASAGQEGENRKSTERWVKRTMPRWPSYVSDSVPEAVKAAAGLSEPERAEASDRLDDYVAATKATGREKHCSFAVYLREKRWEKLPPRPKHPLSDYAPPFGPVWNCWRMARLVDGPEAEGHSPEERWPTLVVLHRNARMGRGHRFGQRWHGLRHLMEAVPVGSAMYGEWQALHEQRGWLWLPDPGDQPVVFFPVGGPEGLGAFEHAVRESAEGRKPDRASEGPASPASDAGRREEKTEKKDDDAHRPEAAE